MFHFHSITLAIVLAFNFCLASSFHVESERDAYNSADLFRNSKTFGGLKNLKTLYLNNNKIQYIRPGLLDDITCLTSFTFSNNPCQITTQNVSNFF